MPNSLVYLPPFFRVAASLRMRFGVPSTAQDMLRTRRGGADIGSPQVKGCGSSLPIGAISTSLRRDLISPPRTWLDASAGGSGTIADTFSQAVDTANVAPNIRRLAGACAFVKGWLISSDLLVGLTRSFKLPEPLRLLTPVESTLEEEPGPTRMLSDDTIMRCFCVHCC